MLRSLQSFLTVYILFSVLQLNAQTIVHPSDVSITEEQAAKEIRRYIFLRTGTAPTLEIADNYDNLPAGDVIVVAANDKAIITELKQEYGNVNAPDSDNRKGYLIKSINKDNRNVLVIAGADTITTLTGAYRFAELIGCHFNLAGDVIPDTKLSYPLDISSFDEKSQPWFELRGCLPFYNFTAGPDLWSVPDYQSFIVQQAKMGFNFFGLHYYNQNGDPSSQEGPEPHLWIGHKEDVNADGSIKPEGAYKSYWASSFREGEIPDEFIWGSRPITTPEFTNGADKLFAYDYFASDAIGSKEPETPAEKAANFNNVGLLLQDAFTLAKQMGIKTAIGHEAPLGFEPGNPEINDEGDEAHLITEDWIRTCPPDVQSRMRDVHGLTLPEDTGIVNEIFSKTLLEGMFTRIARTHPLDYYWLWTYETWSYSGHEPSEKQIETVANDYKYCYDVLEDMNAPFELAAFGWKVGSSGGDGEEAEFHDDLPLEVPFGNLWDGAEGNWAIIPLGREFWSATWYEEDWGLIQPQLRVMNTYYDIGRSLDFGGVQANIAKHWRINSVAPNSAAHAQMIWDNRAPVADDLLTTDEELDNFPDFEEEFDIFETPVNEQPAHFVDKITSFYQDWAAANFGPEKAIEIGSLLAMADRLGEPKNTGEGVQGAIPRASRFLPSSLNEIEPEDGDPTSPTDPTFLDAIDVYVQFCSYKDEIVGTGNIDRYMYWYHFFKGQIELCKLAIHRYNYIEDEMFPPAIKDSIINTWGRLMKHELQRVRNVSELGVIAQLQQQTWNEVLRLELEITDPFSTTYEGENMLRAMPEVSQIYEGSDFEQKVIFMGNGTITNPMMHYRELGSSDPFTSVALSSLNASDNVMMATLTDPNFDFEYYIEGLIGGDTVTYPVTGGTGTDKINKTVITVTEVPFIPTELESATIPVNINSIETDDKALKVFPNPTNDIFRVETTDRIEEINVYNNVGQLILQDRNSKGKVNISRFKAGIYFIQVETNTSIEWAKIIKQ